MTCPFEVFDTTPAAEWPSVNIPAPQLQGMANYRMALGNEASANGDYAQARRHWLMAETYLELARVAA